MSTCDAFMFDVGRETLTEIINRFADSLIEAIKQGERAGVCNYHNQEKDIAQIIIGLHLIAMAAQDWKL